MPVTGTIAANDPVLADQRTFRALLDALARPGQITALDPMGGTVPSPLLAASAAVARCLFDHTTAIWLDPACDTEPVRAFLRLHTGARLTDDAGVAEFAVCPVDGLAARIPTFKAGTADYPDRSATVIVQVAELQDHGGPRLTGPGIDGAARFSFAGADDALWQALRVNHRRFPLGIDCVFCTQDKVACLPRSTRIEIED